MNNKGVSRLIVAVLWMAMTFAGCRKSVDTFDDAEHLILSSSEELLNHIIEINDSACHGYEDFILSYFREPLVDSLFGDKSRLVVANIRKSPLSLRDTMFTRFYEDMGKLGDMESTDTGKYRHLYWEALEGRQKVLWDIDRSLSDSTRVALMMNLERYQNVYWEKLKSGGSAGQSHSLIGIANQITRLYRQYQSANNPAFATYIIRDSISDARLRLENYKSQYHAASE